jgi:hypothetical protein
MHRCIRIYVKIAAVEFCVWETNIDRENAGRLKWITMVTIVFLPEEHQNVSAIRVGVSLVLYRGGASHYVANSDDALSTDRVLLNASSGTLQRVRQLRELKHYS